MRLPDCRAEQDETAAPAIEEEPKAREAAIVHAARPSRLHGGTEASQDDQLVDREDMA